MNHFDTGQALGAEQVQWRLQQARDFLSKEAEKKIQKPRKLQRVSAYKFILCLDHLLRTTVGHGLGMYADRSLSSGLDLTKQPLGLPVLNLVMDQGLVGVAATAFLQNQLHLSLHAQWGTSHRCWNDCKGALKDSGNWGFILLLVVLLNSNHGPWASPAFWEEWKEAGGLLMDSVSCRDSMFQHLLAFILNDRGSADRVLEEGVGKEVWAELRESTMWTSRGPKESLVLCPGCFSRVR